MNDVSVSKKGTLSNNVPFPPNTIIDKQQMNCSMNIVKQLHILQQLNVQSYVLNEIQTRQQDIGKHEWDFWIFR